MKALRWFTFVLIIALLLLPASPTTAQQAEPLSAGDLDPEFGEGGKLVIPLDVDGLSDARLVIQPDGKLLVAANVNTTEGAPSTIIVLRLLPDGSPDASFDGDGRLEVSVAGEHLFLGPLLLQPDGNILVVGTANVVGTATRRIFMARFLPDGSPDISFGEGGMVHEETYPGGLIEEAAAAGLLQDGSILVSGTVVNNEFIGEYDAGIYVARFLPDGSLDESFGQNGFGLDLFELSESELVSGVRDLVIQPDGKIVVVGQAGDDLGNWMIRRFHPDGSFDDGLLFPVDDSCHECFDVAYSVFVLPDGNLLVGGNQSRTTTVDGNTIWLATGFAVMRFGPDLSRDEGFGEGGEVFTNFPGSDNDAAYAMALQADGSILLAGQQRVTDDFALARYNKDSSLDTSFGEAGLVTIDFGGFDIATAVAIQPDGKIVAAGPSWVRDAEGNDHRSLVLVRYLSEGAEGPMEVTIDIRPYNKQNLIVLGKRPMIQVAIFSTAEFDARQIDRSSLTFGRTGEEHSLIRCLRGVDVNRDKLKDLVCFFRTRLTGFQVGDTEGILRGTMQDGTAIEGRDEVVVRRKK